MESVERECGIRGVRGLHEGMKYQREETKIWGDIFIRAHWVAAAIPRDASIGEGPSSYHGKILEETPINECPAAF
jgi:hypothetical protein